MRGIVKKAVSIMLAAVMVLTMAACGEKETETKDDRRVLKWEVVKAGFGTVPYEKLAEAFMEEHPDVLVKIIFNPSISSTTGARLESNTNISDVYNFPSLGSIRRWALEGWVEPIDDVLDATLSTGKTVRDSMTGSAEDVSSYLGTAYCIPEYASVSGFVYNKTLFDKYGWEIPTTTAELDKLCRKILSDTNETVAPIVYCGGAAGGYLYQAVNGWIYQYEGIQNMDNFFDYGSAEVFNPENSKGKMYGLQNLVKFFYDEGNYTMNGSTGMTHIVAQTKVIKGEAAMMVNGSWFENEMSSVLEEVPDVELGMFAVPEVSDAAGNVLHAEGYTTEDNKRTLNAGYGYYSFIPSAAENKEDAKEFLKFLSEPEMCALYTKHSNAVRPFEYELSPDAEVYSDMSTFGKSVLNIANTCYLYAGETSNPIAVRGLTGFWARGVMPFTKIRDGEESIAQALKNDYDYALKNWDRWEETVK